MMGTTINEGLGRFPYCLLTKRVLTYWSSYAEARDSFVLRNHELLADERASRALRRARKRIVKKLMLMGLSPEAMEQGKATVNRLSTPRHGGTSTLPVRRVRVDLELTDNEWRNALSKRLFAVQGQRNRREKRAYASIGKRCINAGFASEVSQ